MKASWIPLVLLAVAFGCERAADAAPEGTSVESTAAEERPVIEVTVDTQVVRLPDDADQRP
jgi:hypothetical protein